MNSVRFKKAIAFLIYFVICAVILLLQSTGLITLQIKTASTMLIIPATVYAGFYFGCYLGAVFGFVSGVLLDIYSSTLVYNTVALAVCGFVCGIVVTYLFNRNLAAASVLNSVFSILYFLVKWLIVYAFSDPVPQFVLWNFCVPSAVYTAVCGIALYFVVMPSFKRLTTIDEKASLSDF